MRGRRAEIVGLCSAACVVVIVFASSTRAVARAGAATGGAPNETSQQVLTIVLPVGVALVLLERGYRPLLEAWLDHGRHWLLYDILPAIRLDPVDA